MSTFATQTANDLITNALRNLNIVGNGQVATGLQIENGLYCLNEIADSWNAIGRMMYATETNQYTIPVPSPNQTTDPIGNYYTVGPGGDFDTGANSTRPVSIFQATITVPGSQPLINDLPMVQLSPSDYALIRAKAIPSNISTYFCYQPTMPLAQLYLWPVPAVATTIKLTSFVTLPTNLTVSSTIAFPPGYAKAIRYELIMAIAGFYGKPVPPDIAGLYDSIRSDITLRNIAMSIPTFQYPSDMPNLKGGAYNIFTDSFGNN
jgi:hypothetical protein